MSSEEQPLTPVQQDLWSAVKPLLEEEDLTTRRIREKLYQSNAVPQRYLPEDDKRQALQRQLHRLKDKLNYQEKIELQKIHESGGIQDQEWKLTEV